jgi:hypothetical protein
MGAMVISHGTLKMEKIFQATMNTKLENLMNIDCGYDMFNTLDTLIMASVFRRWLSELLHATVAPGSAWA